MNRGSRAKLVQEISYESARLSHAEMEASVMFTTAREPRRGTSEIYPQPGARATWRTNARHGYILTSLFATYDPCVSRIEILIFRYSYEP